jgi:hypothetical protein
MKSKLDWEGRVVSMCEARLLALHGVEAVVPCYGEIEC